MMKVFFKTTIFVLGIVTFWSLVTPIFEFPDEQAHIESVEFLAKHGRMPAGEEWDMTAEMKGTQDYLGVFRDRFGNNSYTYHPEYNLIYTDSLIGEHESSILALNNSEMRDTYVWKEAARYPRLYYDYLSVWYRLVESRDIIFRAYVLRLGNSLLALVTAYIIYRAGLLIFRKHSHALTLTTLVMLQPMYTFLSAGINSDNLHNLLFALVIYTGLLIIQKGISLKLILLALCVIALDILAKPQGYIAIPIILVAILISIIQSKKWKLLGSLIILALVGLGAIMSPWNPYSSWINPSNVHGASLVEFLRFSLNKLVAQNIVWYWGVFKWLGVVLPPIYWQLANRIVLVGGLGLLAYLIRVIKQKKLIAIPFITLYLLLATLIYTFAIYYFDWQYTKAVGYSIGVQARYLFPTISAQMALLMIGVLSLGWTPKLRLWLRRGLVIFILWIQLGALWRLLSSYYDLSSLNIFITQASQYKPDFAKGDLWYLYLVLYLLSLASIVYLNFAKKPIKKKKKLSPTPQN